MKDHLHRSILGGLLLAASTMSSAASMWVDVVPGGGIDDTMTVAPGANFSVAILVGDVLDLAGFEFNLLFNPSVIVATDISSAGLFDPETFSVADTVGASYAGLAEITLAISGLDVAAPALVAIVDFDALAPGVSNLSLTDVVLSDSLSGQITPIDVNDAKITVEAVPIPSTLILTLLAAVPLFLFRRATA